MRRARKRTLIGTASESFAVAARARVLFVLTKNGKRILRGSKHGAKITAVMTFTPTGGGAVSSSKQLTLRR